MATGGFDCPPPPPPPPPNNNNNNNKPKSPCVPNNNQRRRRRHGEISGESNGFREQQVVRPTVRNNSLHTQVEIFPGHNGNFGNFGNFGNLGNLGNLRSPRSPRSLRSLRSLRSFRNLRDHLEVEVEPEPQHIHFRFRPEDNDDDLALQGAAAAAAPTIFFDDDCLEFLPEKFDGNPDNLSYFISQCQTFMERSNRDFSADRIRVCFVTSMLTGRAARWASIKLERASYLMNNYRAFMMELKQVFEDPQRREAAKRKIRRLRQGLGSVAEYANSFQMIAHDLDWNEHALIDQFLEGLSDEIREEVSRHELPNTLSALISLAIHIERRQARAAAAAAAAARKPRPDPPRALVMPQNRQSDPTEPVGGARMRLTQEEKERRRKLNLCLYCGSGGHYADNCPAKASKNSPSGNSPAPL